MRCCNWSRGSCSIRVLAIGFMPVAYGCDTLRLPLCAFRCQECSDSPNGLSRKDSGALAEEEQSMALTISPVHRNLHTRVTFLHLEFEDWFVVIGLAALTNIFGRWVDRSIFGIPMNVFLQYIVPVLSVPFLMLFKYGKPHGYLKDFLAWHTKPRIAWPAPSNTVFCVPSRAGDQNASVASVQW